jgi:hypothetical protein
MLAPEAVAPLAAAVWAMALMGHVQQQIKEKAKRIPCFSSKFRARGKVLMQADKFIADGFSSRESRRGVPVFVYSLISGLFSA